MAAKRGNIESMHTTAARRKSRPIAVRVTAEQEMALAATSKPQETVRRLIEAHTNLPSPGPRGSTKGVSRGNYKKRRR